MAAGDRRVHALLYAAAALLFALQVLPRLSSGSLAMDEEWDLTNAAYYWHDGDASQKDGALPLTGSLQGLPSRFLSPVYGPIPEGCSPEVRAYYFLYYLNRARLGVLAASGRAVSLLAGLGMGFLLFLLARTRGTPFLAAALLFWAFDPMLVGMAGVARNDIMAAFLSTAALALRPDPRRLDASAWDWGWSGMVAGMAVLTKPTAFFVVPALLGLEAWDALRGPKGAFRAVLPRAVVLVSGMLLWVFLAYLPTALAVRPAASPFAFFGRYLSWVMRFDSIGNIPYFLGAVRERGAFLALPVSMFFKWTLPFTGWLLLGMGLVLRRRVEWPAAVGIPLAAMALTLLPGMHSKLCRHLLPAYPFLIWTAAAAARWAWERTQGSRARRFLVAAALLWHPVSSLAHFPDALAYMNDLVPRKRKAFFLNAYNWDLNQDAAALAAAARARSWGTVRFANSGRVDPYFYGLEWEPWTAEDLEGPQPGTVYVLNASLLTAPDPYLGPFASVKTSWASRRAPTGWVGDTWIYHEIPGTPAPRRSPIVNSFPYFRIDLIPYRMDSAYR